MSVPDSIKQLLGRFEANREAYRSNKYNETQARREFIDPFFKALSWDIDNEQGYVEAYKDVIHEPTLAVEGETKAPDYAFRVGGARKLFVEFKKPSVNNQMSEASEVQPNRIMALHKQGPSTSREREMYQRETVVTDRAIAANR